MATWSFTVGFGFKTDSDSFYHSWLLKPTQKIQFTIGFSLKIDSELGLLCQFEQPTVIEAITAGFKTKTGSEGPCTHLLVKKNIKKTLSV